VFYGEFPFLGRYVLGDAYDCIENLVFKFALVIY